MNPNPVTLYVVAVMLSCDVYGGPAVMDGAVLDSTEKSQRECEPMPRTPTISRIETNTPVPTVSNFARPKG